MAARFTVLASGSSGNASLLEHDGFGLLVDCGVGPQIITERLAVIGRTWSVVSAVLLTHTHGDHWNSYTLAHLRRLQIPLFAHRQHHDALSARREHLPLRRGDLLREFPSLQPFKIGPTLSAFAVPVPHDSEPTFAFRFDGEQAGSGWSLGFASDVGHPTRDLMEAFAGVDGLAVEFNHDVAMQRASRRPRILVDRVLGQYGHLSNAQAGELTRSIARLAPPDRLRFLVQLHLSRECNRPELAAREGRAALQAVAPKAQLVTASQFVPTPPLSLGGAATDATVRHAPAPRITRQPCLPGLEPPHERVAG